MGSKRRRAVAEDADEALKQSIKKTSDAVKAVAEPNELPTKKTKKHKKNAASAEPASSVKVDAPVMAATPPLSEESKKKKKKNKGSTSDAAASVAKPAATDNATVPAKEKSNEIDDLFQSLKSKKKEQIEAEEKQQREEKAAIKKKKKEKERLDEQIKRLEAKMRYDQDGLPIYTEESLQINQGAGDTADCPFDCWCCF